MRCVREAARRVSVLSPLVAVEKDLEIGRNVNRGAAIMARRL